MAAARSSPPSRTLTTLCIPRNLAGVTNPTSLALFQTDLRNFVRSEFEARRAQMARLWAMPVSERVEDGRCVAGGSVKRCRPPRGLIVAFPANDSRFREGDFVRLSRGNPETPLAEAVVVSADDEDFELEIRGAEAASLPIPAGCDDLQIDESFIDLENRYLSAIDDLGRTEIGREKILPFLEGQLRPSLDLETYDEKSDQATRDGFNDDQAKAIAAALASDLGWLIHGPPGTGKTHVLAQIVRNLLEGGKRVLVTSANHRTIDNLLEAIAEATGDRRNLFKVAPFRSPTLSIDQFGSYSEIATERTGGGFVIGATPYAARSSRLQEIGFDTVIIDEASQVTLPLAVMAMLAGQRYIFAGDHQQLPPVSPGTAGEVPSIFGRLAGRGLDTMLTTTYRLNEPLCAWPSSTFYLSRLEPSASAAVRRLTLSAPVPGFETLLAPDPANVWLAVPHEGARTSCPEEIEAIAEILLALRHGGIDWKDVGVVVPFRRQARLLRQRLARHVSHRGGAPVADTVERMQGQERDVVLVSFTTSDLLLADRLSGFLFQPQRLNVAATRARKKLILLASPALLDFAKSHLPDEVAAAFVSLLESCHRIDDIP